MRFAQALEQQRREKLEASRARGGDDGDGPAGVLTRIVQPGDADWSAAQHTCVCGSGVAT
jgi:hypothetical protein